MKLQYISSTLIDCFWGDGWDNQARVKITPKRVVIRSSTRPVPLNFVKLVHRAMDRQQGSNRG